MTAQLTAYLGGDLLNIIAETRLTIDITYRGRGGVLKLHGGEWQWCEGGGRVRVAAGGLKWTVALQRILDRLEAEARAAE